MRRWRMICVCVLAAASTSVLQAQSRTPDITKGALLRHVWSAITDSISGGGRREGQLYFAGDSLAKVVFARMKESRETARAGADTVACPGSTVADGTPLPDPVGYQVRVGLIAQADSSNYVLAISKSCLFFYRGSISRLNAGFMEGMSWELRFDNGTWRVGRRLSHVIT